MTFFEKNLIILRLLFISNLSYIMRSSRWKAYLIFLLVVVGVVGAGVYGQSQDLFGAFGYKHGGLGSTDSASSSHTRSFPGVALPSAGSDSSVAMASLQGQVISLEDSFNHFVDNYYLAFIDDTASASIYQDYVDLEALQSDGVAAAEVLTSSLDAFLIAIVVLIPVYFPEVICKRR